MPRPSFRRRFSVLNDALCRLEHAWKASKGVVEFYKERAEIEMHCAKAIIKLHKETSEKSMFNKRTITELEIAPSVAMAWTALEAQTAAAAEGHKSFSLKVTALASDLSGFLKERSEKRKQCAHCFFHIARPSLFSIPSPHQPPTPPPPPPPPLDT